jgi:hypothetical protein
MHILINFGTSGKTDFTEVPDLTAQYAVSGVLA